MLDFLIITAASEAFAESLLALLGSLTLNWPRHPQVLVYDIGLSSESVRRFERLAVPVKRVPDFCAHWRRHFTWKLWCLVDAPAEALLWIDAGVAVLSPIDEIVNSTLTSGHFLTTNQRRLEDEVSEQALAACKLSRRFCRGKLTCAATLMGINKRGPMKRVIDDALRLGCAEPNIAATNVAHRHDQAILSLLIYRRLGAVRFADSGTYLGSLSPDETVGQKIWVHRRRMLRADLSYLAAHVRREGLPYRPRAPYSLQRARSLDHLYRTYWHFGLRQYEAAARHLRSAFEADCSLRSEEWRVLRLVRRYSDRLDGDFPDPLRERSLYSWVVNQLRECPDRDDLVS